MTKPAPSLGNYVYQQLLQQICVDNPEFPVEC